MKKRNLFLLMICLIGLMLVSSVYAKTFDKVFEPIKDVSEAIFELAATDIGFKIFITLLFFTLFFAGISAAMKQLNKNIRVVLSLIIAILAAVIIPIGSIKILFGLYSGFLFFLALAALPIYLLYFAIRKVEGDDRPAYAFRLLLSFLALTILTLFGGENVFGNILGTNLNVGALDIGSGFSGVIGIIMLAAMIMTIYYVIKTVSPGGPEHEEKREREAAKNKEESLKTKRAAARAKVSVINDKITEEQELKLIDKTEDKVTEVINLIDARMYLGKYNKKNEIAAIPVKIEELKTKHLKKAIGFFEKRIYKTTWREESRMNRVITELKKQKIDPNKLAAQEAEVLKVHKETYDLLKKAEQFLSTKIKKYQEYQELAEKEWDNDVNPPTTELTLTDDNTNNPLADKKGLESIKNEIDNVKDNIKEAKEKQREVSGLVNAIVVEAQKLVEEAIE